MIASASTRKRLTARQQFVLDTIRRFLDENRYPPTIRELMHLLSIRSPNGMMCHLTALELKGYITRKPNAARGIRIVGERDRPVGRLPIGGRIKAGDLSLAFSLRDEEWDWLEWVESHDEVRIADNTNEARSIRNGDLLLMRDGKPTGLVRWLEP